MIVDVAGVDVSGVLFVVAVAVLAAVFDEVQPLSAKATTIAALTTQNRFDTSRPYRQAQSQLGLSSRLNGGLRRFAEVGLVARDEGSVIARDPASAGRHMPVRGRDARKTRPMTTPA